MGGVGAGKGDKMIDWPARKGTTMSYVDLAVQCKCGTRDVTSIAASLTLRTTEMARMAEDQDIIPPTAARRTRGQIIGKRGYIWTIEKGHPRANRDGYVSEHVLVAERAIGRFLEPSHPIHHFDGNPANNHNGNLVICEDQAYHKLLHQRQTAFAKCGNPSALHCDICHSFDHQDDIRAYSYRRGKGRYGRHLSCNRAHVRRYVNTESR